MASFPVRGQLNVQPQPLQRGAPCPSFRWRRGAAHSFLVSGLRRGDGEGYGPVLKPTALGYCPRQSDANRRRNFFVDGPRELCLI